MRVLLTVPSLRREFGGPAILADQLSSALRVLGVDIVVAGCGEAQHQAPSTIALPVLGRFHGTPLPATTAPLRRLAAEADIVHVLGYRDPVGSAAARAARRASVPYILEPVGMHRRRLRSVRLKGGFDRTLGRPLMQKAEVVIATSHLEARELETDGVDPVRIVIRPNGIDVASLLPLPSRGSFRRAGQIPADAPLVLSLGRITAKKGLLELVDAVTALDGVWLAVAGPDDGDGTLERLQQRVGAPDAERVRLVARGLWDRQKAEAFADADVFCLPSATENFGIVVAEAAAVGLPVVISDACGVGEWLESGSTRIVRFGDVAALRKGLGEALSPMLAEAARSIAPDIRSRLSWAALGVAQLEIYRGCVSPSDERGRATQ